MIAAFDDQAASLIRGVGKALVGVRFPRASLGREPRQRRADPEGPPAVRSDKTGRLIKIACFCLGALVLIAGLLLTFLPVFARD